MTLNVNNQSTPQSDYISSGQPTRQRNERNPSLSPQEELPVLTQRGHLKTSE